MSGILSSNVLSSKTAIPGGRSGLQVLKSFEDLTFIDVPAPSRLTSNSSLLKNKGFSPEEIHTIQTKVPDLDVKVIIPRNFETIEVIAKYARESAVKEGKPAVFKKDGVVVVATTNPNETVESLCESFRKTQAGNKAIEELLTSAATCKKQDRVIDSLVATFKALKIAKDLKIPLTKNQLATIAKIEPTKSK